ncbi:helix-turn-helix transcriptional regulator [Serratia marcescens]
MKTITNLSDTNCLEIQGASLLIKDGEFPKPIKLGRSSRWTESEVKTWLKQRIEASRGH